MKKLIIILLCFTQVNAQTLCDSLSFNININQTLTVTGVNSSIDSVNFMWGVCDNTACYSASGDTASFPLVSIFDTVKVCYDISPQWSCTECCYVVFNGTTWQPLNVVTHVDELYPTPRNGKIYNLLGKELSFIPVGKMYIRNNKLYINK